jgi:VWFA-related protein
MPTKDGPPRQIRTDDDEEAEAAKDDVRLFAVFLDDYHVRQGTSVGVRDQLTRFIEQQLGPSDMVGIMHPLTPMASVRMTRNHSTVTRAIQQFRGRKFDYVPQNEFEERYAYAPTETVETIRNQVSLTALKALIVHMGGLKEGRKALILVSEGYSNIVPPQMRDQIASMPGSGNPNRGNANAGINDPNEQRYQFFSGQDLEFWMQGVYEAASQNNVAIYAIDPRGLPVFEFDINEGGGINPTTDREYLSTMQNTLRALALETDGRAIMNRNDLDVGMKQIIRDSSAYYLIGYTSPAKSDGKFHSVNVRVKRPGVQVRARKGYWALTPETAAVVTAPPKAGPPPEVAAALASAVQTPRTRSVRTWIGTSRGENGKTKLTFVWEPTPRTANDRPVPASDQPTRVALTAINADGSPSFRGRVPDMVLASASPTAAGASSAPASRGPARATFEVAPGKIQLRIAVEGAASQVLDSELREITVPDLSGPVVLGTPEVFRSRTLRDYQLLKADRDAVPVPARDFSRTERVLVRVMAYGPAGSMPTVKARLLNRDGQPMSELPVTAAESAGAPAQFDLPLSGLAPGEYVIEIMASTPAGDAKQLIGFRVTA